MRLGRISFCLSLGLLIPVHSVAQEPQILDCEVSLGLINGSVIDSVTEPLSNFYQFQIDMAEAKPLHIFHEGCVSRGTGKEAKFKGRVCLRVQALGVYEDGPPPAESEPEEEEEVDEEQPEEETDEVDEDDSIGGGSIDPQGQLIEGVHNLFIMVTHGPKRKIDTYSHIQIPLVYRKWSTTLRPRIAKLYDIQMECAPIAP